MYKNRIIPLSVPNIGGNEWKYLKNCLDTGWVSSAGKYVNLFEEKIGQTVGSENIVACVNGTAALQMSLLIAGVKDGDEVIVPDVTFIAPVNAIRYLGAEPVFMDCDDHLNMDPEKYGDFIRQECFYKGGKLVNKRTRKRISAVIPVHVFGNPVNIFPILKVSKKYGIAVIEDATESIGSYYTAGPLKGKYTGAVGDAGCFSFNGNKLLTTGGGGAISFKSVKLAGKAKYLTTQAKDDEKYYIHNEIGYNFRLSNVQAAIGLAQLERLDEFIEIKRRNFRFYSDMLSEVKGLSFVSEPDYAFSNFWFYSLLVDEKTFGMSNFELMLALEKEGIQTRPLWQLNHKQKPYRKNHAYRIEKAKAYYNKVLNIPCSTGISREEMSRVVKAIKKYGK